MDPAPLFVLTAQPNPRIGAAIKMAMCISALVIAFLALLLPKVLHFEDNLITGTMLAIAFTDLGLAFVLPSVIEKQISGAEYRFFRDRLVINFGNRQHPLPYENIKSIEDLSSERDKLAGVVNIRVTTLKPHDIPLFGTGTSLILSSLAPFDEPLGKIKEVVENSRRK